jgi:hypothetical protein
MPYPNEAQSLDVFRHALGGCKQRLGFDSFGAREIAHREGADAVEVDFFFEPLKLAPGGRAALERFCESVHPLAAEW